MMMEREGVLALIEEFIRDTCNIPADTPGFTRSCDLFEEGFVDSMALVRLVAFLESEFDVEIEEENLFDERFLTIEGQGDLVLELKNSVGR